MALHALSPLDGRYENETAPLREFFSEFAFMRARARLELDFLSALSKTGVFPSRSDWQSDLLSRRAEALRADLRRWQAQPYQRVRRGLHQ